MEIGFLLFDHSAEPDFAGPCQLLGRLDGVHVHLVAERNKPVVMDCGCSINPTARFADAPELDLICVPGGSGVAAALQSPRLLDYLNEAASQAKWLAAVGTGAFLLGGAGLLIGRRATTAPPCASLLDEIGAVYSADDVVTDGNVLTCSGANFMFDFTMALAEAVGGKAAARRLRTEVGIHPEVASTGCDRSTRCGGRTDFMSEDGDFHVRTLRETLHANVIGYDYTL